MYTNLIYFEYKYKLGYNKKLCSALQILVSLLGSAYPI